jgi:hypothetical protein
VHAIVLLLLVDPSPDVATSALTAASIDGLAGRAELVVEHVKSAPPDDQAFARATQLKADVIVEVTWPSGDDSRAHLHAHLRRASPWVERDLGFAATAPAWERGRAIGLAIAAMVPDDEPAPPTPTSPSAPTPTSPATPTSDTPTTTTTRTAMAPRTPPVRDAGTAERPPSPPTPSAPARVAIGALGELAPSSGGEGFGGGARVDATWALTPRLLARASAGARFEPFPDARAHVSTFGAGGGLALQLFTLADGSSLVARADLLATYVTVLRDRRDGSTERHGRFVPATALFAEGSLALSTHTSLVVALGLELAFGTTTIAVADGSTFALPRARPLGQVGFRWAF